MSEQKPITIYDMFLTSDKLEKEGVIFEYEYYGNIFEITCARAGGKNRKFLETRDEFMKNFSEKNGDAEGDIYIHKLWARAVIKGWKNIHDEKGDPLEFNEKNCVKLLSDLPDLFSDLRRRSIDFNEFKARVVGKAEKNS